MDLDATDRRILSALQKDGRLTNADLSEQVNLSPSACHRRVQRLESQGLIDAYVALLNSRKLGRAGKQDAQRGICHGLQARSRWSFSSFLRMRCRFSTDR